MARNATKNALEDNGASVPSLAHNYRSVFSRRLFMAIGLFNFLLIVFATTTLYRDYLRSEHDARITTRNISQILAQSLSSTIREVELGLLAVRDEYERQLATGQIDENHLNRFILRQHSYLPQTDSLRIADANGEIRYGVGVNPKDHITVADRGYFRKLQSASTDELILSEPILGRISHQWVFIIARRLNAPNGAFAGVVYAVMTLSSLERQFSAVNLGPRGLASLRNANLELIARSPPLGPPEETLGRRQPSADWDTFVGDRSEGTQYSPNGTDNTARVLTFRKVSPYPLYIFVGIAKETYLAAWWLEVARLSFLLLLSFVATIVSGIIIHRTRKREEQVALSLAKQQEMYRIVADNTLDWEFWLAPDGHYIYCSPSCLERTGYAASEFLNSPARLFDIIHPDDKTSFANHQHSSLCEGNVPYSGPLRILHANGKVRWFEHSCRPVYDENGAFLGVRGNNRDVTERHQAEEERRYLFDIIERSLNEIYLFDPETLRFKHVNHGALSNLQYSAKAIIELTPIDIKPQFDETSFRKLIQPLLDGRDEVLVFETIHQRADRTTYPVEVHLQLVNAGDHQVFLAVIFDITERKQAEQAKDDAIARVRTLEGIIPICMYCKRIRDNQNTWSQLERYLSEHSEARFSHGICPRCLAERKDEFE